MNAVLDAPTITPLDESILDAVLSCVNCNSVAEWRWSTRCCGASAHLCDTHDATGYRTAADVLVTSRAMCGGCGRVHGYGVRFADFYRRHEL